MRFDPNDSETEPFTRVYAIEQVIGCTDEEYPKRKRTAERCSSSRMYASAVGNFSIQYNLSCLAIAIILIDSALEVPSWANTLLFGIVFAGCIVGMVCMGVLGDVIGHSRGLAIASAIISVTALMSACCTWPGYHMWEVLITCRGLMGIGIGGVYPLAASSAAECGTQTAVAWSFFWQSPGIMAPYIVSVLLIAAGVDSVLAFRFVLAFGALPSLFVVAASLSEPDVKPIVRSDSTLHGEISQKKYWVLLIGTGGSWLLFDVAYYGTSIFVPFILRSIFELDSLTPWDLSVRSIYSACFACIGTLCAVAFLQKWEARALNIIGFLLMAVSFACFALSRSGFIVWSANANFFLFTALLFSINFGPNTATYVLPTQVYPKNVRGTFHGFSSSLGKIGAVVGAFLYPGLRGFDVSLGCIMGVQACVCLSGALVANLLPRTPSSLDT